MVAHSIERPQRSIIAFGASAVLTKFVAALLQLFMGFIFLPETFGAVALFTSLAIFANALRDGGVKSELIRLGTGLKDPKVSEALWLSFIINVSIAVSMALLAAPISSIYGVPDLKWLLICLAASYPLGTLWSVYGPLIQTQFSSREYVQIEMEGETVRLAASIALLLAWPNPMALAIGFCLQAFWLSLRSTLRLRQALFVSWPGTRALWRLWRSTRWLMLGTLAAAFLQSGDNLALGLVTSTSILGGYYFAYSFAAQAGLVAVALGDSMLLHLGSNEQGNRAKILLTATRRLVSTTGIATFTLAVAFPSIENAIWGGKWDFAVQAAQLIALAFPLRLTFIIQKVSLVSAGLHFRWAGFTMMQGGGMFLTALMVGSMTNSLTLIAVGISVYMASATSVFLILALHGFEAKVLATVRSLGLGLLPALAAGVAGWLASTACAALALGPLPQLALTIPASAVGGLVAVRLLDAAFYKQLVMPMLKAVGIQVR